MLPESKVAAAPAMTNGTQQQQQPDSGKDSSAGNLAGGAQGGVAEQTQGVEGRKGSMPVVAAG